VAFRRLGRSLSVALVVLLLLTLPGLLRLAMAPPHLRLFPGQAYLLREGFFYRWVDPEARGWLASTASGLRLQSDALGHGRLELRLLGWLPLGTMEVSVVPRVQVVPGGQSIGVLAAMDGLVIERTVDLPARPGEGSVRSPAAEAGVRAGDRLLSIDGHPVQRLADVERWTQLAGRQGRPVRLEVERGSERLSVRVRPLRVEEGGQERFLLGILLRETTAGVGTLTFYHPGEQVFAALGHQVTDSRNRPVTLHQGRIVLAPVEGLRRSLSGDPGEKVGVLDGSGPLGIIEKNTPFGIYGRLLREPPHGLFDHPIPVALAHEVRPGPAQMLTVLEGQSVQAFEVEILEVRSQRAPSDRGLVLEITDPRLLARTDGIIQGMSGSPIIQNDRLVGAVTHVFVNQPRRGFGILAEWMVYETGLDQALPWAEGEPQAREAQERKRVA